MFERCCELLPRVRAPGDGDRKAKRKKSGEKVVGDQENNNPSNPKAQEPKHPSNPKAQEPRNPLNPSAQKYAIWGPRPGDKKAEINDSVD